MKTAFLATLLVLCATSLEAQAPLPGATPFEIQVVPAPPGEPWRLLALEREGVFYVAANHLAAALHLEKFWRADLGRLILAGKSHRITVTEGTDLAVIDDGRLLHLAGPVFLWQGQMMLPLDLFVDANGEPLPWIEEPLVFSKSDRTLRVAAPRPTLLGSVAQVTASGWALRIEASGRVRAEARQEAGPELIVHLNGARYDSERHPLPKGRSAWLPWIHGFRGDPSPEGVEIHILPSPQSRGFRVATLDSNRVEIVLGPYTDTLTPFSGTALAELRRIALDPGHGGSDAGVTVRGGKEAKLNWTLAGFIRERLEQAGMQVVLTRTEDQDPEPLHRADAANQGNADLFVSLHVHGRPGGPMAFLDTGTGKASGGSSMLESLGFQHYGVDRFVYESESRSIAALLLQAIMTSGTSAAPSPGIRMESVPELSGVRMPALLLEMGTDAKGGWSDERLRTLADAIATGITRAAGAP